MTQSNGKTVAGFTSSAQDKLQEETETEQNEEGMENHIKAAEHFTMAAKCHYEACNYHREAKHEKANQSALLAAGHSSLALFYQKKDTEYHALES